MREYPVNPNVFNGGAVVVNSAPFANFFMQQQRQQQAKEQALEGYYRDQEKTMTPTGMRAKDIEGGWSNKLNEWKRLGIEKKQYILNPAKDNYRTINEFNRLGNDLRTDIERSKQAAKDEDMLRTAKMSGKWNPTDSDFEIAHDNSLSIYDRNRRGLSLDGLSVNYPPFDAKKYLDVVQGGMKRGTVEDRPILNPKAGIMTTHSREEYKPEEIKAMAEKAPFIMQTDPSSKIEFERMLHSNALPELQSAYEKIFPGDIVNTPEKAAKAFTILNTAQPTGFGVKNQKYEDRAEAEASQKRLIDYRANAAIKVHKANATTSATEAKGVLNGIVSDMIVDAKKHPVPMTWKNEVVTSYDMPLTEEVAKAVMLPGETTAPNAVRYLEKGGEKYIRRITYKAKWKQVGEKMFFDGYETAPDGKPKIDEDLSRTIPIKQFRDRVGKELYSGKVLYNEQGQPVDLEDITNSDDEVGYPSSGQSAQPRTKSGSGDWRTRATKIK